MLRISFCLLTLSVVSESAPGARTLKCALQNSGDELIAIGVLLEPDRTLVHKSRAVRALLQGNIEAGYEVDASNAHITLLQRFVRSKDLYALTDLLRKVVVAERPTRLRLMTKDYGYEIWDGGAVMVIVIERTPELMRLHRKALEAVAPFSVSGGTAAAFAAPDIDIMTISCVETFVPEFSGENYLPHVIAGVIKKDPAERMEAEPYRPFTFRANGIAVYQLGNFGAPAKKLWSWTSKQ